MELHLTTLTQVAMALRSATSPETEKYAHTSPSMAFNGGVEKQFPPLTQGRHLRPQDERCPCCRRNGLVGRPPHVPLTTS